MDLGPAAGGYRSRDAGDSSVGMIRRSVGNGGPQARSTAGARLPTVVGRGPRLRLAVGSRAPDAARSPGVGPPGRCRPAGRADADRGRPGVPCWQRLAGPGSRTSSRGGAGARSSARRRSWRWYRLQPLFSEWVLDTALDRAVALFDTGSEPRAVAYPLDSREVTLVARYGSGHPREALVEVRLVRGALKTKWRPRLLRREPFLRSGQRHAQPDRHVVTDGVEKRVAHAPRGEKEM